MGITNKYTQVRCNDNLAVRLARYWLAGMISIITFLAAMIGVILIGTVTVMIVYYLLILPAELIQGGNMWYGLVYVVLLPLLIYLLSKD